MKVFISWSGPRSHQTALTLRKWLPSVLPDVAPWVSSEDIEKGARWGSALTSELDTTRFGILCLVPENVGSSWVIFEAGAISRSIEASRVAPFLVGVHVKDVPGPLAQFQCTVFEKEDVRKLVHSINRASAAPIDPSRLDQAFERHWPDLEGSIQSIDNAPPREALVRERVAPPAAPHEDLFKEPGGLAKEQVAILTVLAKNPDVYPTANDLVHAIGENQTRTQYHLDRLRQLRLINHRLVSGRPAAYYLTEAGRAYVVQNNLDRQGRRDP